MTKQKTEIMRLRGDVRKARAHVTRLSVIMKELEKLFNDDLLLIAEKCGIETAIKLMANLPGGTIFVPEGK